MQTAEFKIRGMACSGCVQSVKRVVNKLTGIIKANISHENGNAIIEFEPTKTDVNEIEQAISEAGYIITAIKEI